MKKSARLVRSRKQVQNNSRGGRIIAMVALGPIATVSGQMVQIPLVMIDQLLGETVQTGFQATAIYDVDPAKFAYRVDTLTWIRPSTVKKGNGFLRIESELGDPFVSGQSLEITTEGFVDELEGLGQAVLMPSCAGLIVP